MKNTICAFIAGLGVGLGLGIAVTGFAQEVRDPATQPLLQMLSGAQYGLASCIGSSQVTQQQVGALQTQLAAANAKIAELTKAQADAPRP